MMLGFDDLMMTSGGIDGITDPFAANRTYMFRGDGINGARPTTDDLGNTPFVYADATPANTGGYSSARNRWPGTYATSMRLPNGAMRVPATNGTQQNAAFRNAMNGSPFSLLMRLWLDGTVGGANQFIRQIAQTTGGGWGGNGVMMNIYQFAAGDGINTRLNVQMAVSDSSTGNRGDIAVVNGVSLNAWHELLLTRDVTNTHRAYLDGALVGSLTKAPLVAASITEQMISTGCDVAYGSTTAMNLVDDIFYDTCIQSAASYTPAIKPYQ